MKAVIATTAELRVQAERLYALSHTDAADAIRRVGGLQVEPSLASHLQSIQASLLIDIGSEARRKDAVEQGVGLARQLTAAHPESDECRYNLANGLIALADLDCTRWLVALRDARGAARSAHADGNGVWDRGRESSDPGLHEPGERA
jgi:hypothetical protein